MPQTGEFHHHMDWVQDSIRQLIHIASLLEGEPSPAKEAVKMREIIDTDEGVRYGAHIFVNVEQCSEEVQDMVRDVFTGIKIPGITITQAETTDDHSWRIDASVKDLVGASQNHPARGFRNSARWNTIFSNGWVSPLVLELDDTLSRTNYRLIGESVMPLRLSELAGKISGANPQSITVECIADDERFEQRVRCRTSDATDPLWQKIMQEATIVQRGDFGGTSGKFLSKPLEFEGGEGEKIIALSGPLSAVQKVVEAVQQKVAPELPSFVPLQMARW